MKEPNYPVGPFGHRRVPVDLDALDPAERFERRVVHMMNTSGLDRTWSRQRVRESHPEEWEAYNAARNNSG